jgi:hypothetical protein
VQGRRGVPEMFEIELVVIVLLLLVFNIGRESKKCRGE